MYLKSLMRRFARFADRQRPLLFMPAAVVLCAAAIGTAAAGGTVQPEKTAAASATASDAAADTRKEDEDRVPENGWYCRDGVTRYYRDGEMLCSGFAEIGGKRYYFYGDGAMAYGISEIGDGRYAFEAGGAFVTDGWLALGGDWYLAAEDGSVLTGYQWADGGLYYLADDGKLQCGGVTPDGCYNLNADGRAVSLNLEETSEGCPLRDAPGTSGYEIGGYPVELFLLSMAGETGGGQIINGDGGRAYGLCQFDYRYDLADFINYACQIHPALWVGFEELAGTCSAGDESLIANDTVTEAFALAQELSPASCAADQMTFLYHRYFANTYRALENAGYHLNGRHIAVSAALMSISINCGEHPALYLGALSPEMTDDEMIEALYRLRNTELAKNGKGSSCRYRESEPELAVRMLNGEITALSSFSLPGGVSWSPEVLRFCGETLGEEEIQARLAALGSGFRSDGAASADANETEETKEAAEETAAAETDEASPVILAGASREADTGGQASASESESAAQEETAATGNSPVVTCTRSAENAG